ncbi:hypothetical protein ACE193_06985 [Bernardetia sp. OM2101]|uniref:hypothetical protein n=1 Tax=Bernardetia sp. OM2101 TaxID=3344876 RepID=UPI0035CF168A
MFRLTGEANCYAQVGELVVLLNNTQYDLNTKQGQTGAVHACQEDSSCIGCW